ncbi:DNA-binding MarR family transcriptional regulator [Sphingomonas sp. BE123]|uniref:hypothetical protein n=1 Tax=Sphingomonas sp. BE123 TaxID=2817842 RepID=UPI0028598561|nr:hypothetical protein [Sphingomonas sp. BE123]MDR6853406.1 DNA-binding MarR family transcriptional regulator [Sphingomonas sp. BE123]
MPDHGAAIRVERHVEPSGPAFDLAILDFTVGTIASALTAFGNLNSAILFAATARACGPFGTNGERRQPVSINALAASLGRPFETVRRHANALVEDGLIARSPDGLYVALDSVVEPRVAALVDCCHDRMVALVDQAQHLGDTLPGPHPGIAYDPRVGIGLALDLLLAALECHGQREETPLRLALLLTLERAALRAALDASPSQVIRTSDVARMLDLPYATASRNIDALVACGLVGRDGGHLAPVADDAAVAARMALAGRARVLIARLAQAGFPVTAPTTALIRPRPSLAMAG